MMIGNITVENSSLTSNAVGGGTIANVRHTRHKASPTERCHTWVPLLMEPENLKGADGLEGGEGAAWDTVFAAWKRA